MKVKIKPKASTGPRPVKKRGGKPIAKGAAQPAKMRTMGGMDTSKLASMIKKKLGKSKKY